MRAFPFGFAGRPVRFAVVLVGAEIQFRLRHRRQRTGSQRYRQILLGDRRLYLCTADRPDLERFVEACIAGGVDIVQLRDKNLEARPLLERARRLLRVCRGLGVPFVLNDRPDLALEAGADGVHVGQDDASPSLCRRFRLTRAARSL